MDRRTFVGFLTAAGTGWAAPRKRLFLDIFRLESAAHLARASAQLSQSRPILLLEAIAASHLPQLAVLSEFRPGGASSRRLALTGEEESLRSEGVFELRAYRIPEGSRTGTLDHHLNRLFHNAGVHPVLRGADEGRNLVYLIGFPDLTAREQAWRRARAPGAEVTRIAIYAPVNRHGGCPPQPKL